MKLLIFGGGDLTQRTVPLVAQLSCFREIVICTRERARGEPLARLFDGGLSTRVRHAEADYASTGALTVLLRAERPDLIFHAASMISPWPLPGRNTLAVRALASAGFGLMLPVQLVFIRSVMRAVRELGLMCPVVNASYPDATHAVLAAEGLAPTVGVGNAGMLFNLVSNALSRAGAGGHSRLFAHHAQITPFVRDGAYAPGVEPWLHRPEGPVSLNSIVSGPLPTGQVLNTLTAQHAVQIIAALAADTAVLTTSVPGPLGEQGGWPVQISTTGVALDLPPDVSLERGRDYQVLAARGDGIAVIYPDGTVDYTDAARRAMAAVAPRLAEPLRLDRIDDRSRELVELAG